MNEPYFQVGEAIILKSQDYPERNGEYIVTSHFYGLAQDSFSGERSIAHSYELNDIPRWWDQRALRKKHKPSDESFSQLINNLQPTETIL